MLKVYRRLTPPNKTKQNKKQSYIAETTTQGKETENKNEIQEMWIHQDK